MVGDLSDIRCSKCGKYLFTEKDTEYGYRRENDNKNYSYDPSEDEFICDDCSNISLQEVNNERV